MKRCTLLLLSLLSTAGTLSAQQTYLKAGIWAGLGYASTSIGGARFSFGMGGDISLYRNRFSLSLRPSFDRRGYSLREAQIRPMVQASYFDIPLLVEYCLTSSGPRDSRFYIGAGGYYGIAFAGHMARGHLKRKLTFGEAADNDRSANDKGLVLTLGFRLPNGSKCGLQGLFSASDITPAALQNLADKSDQRLSAVYLFTDFPLIDLRKPGRGENYMW
jgi:hypothetical protein